MREAAAAIRDEESARRGDAPPLRPCSPGAASERIGPRDIAGRAGCGNDGPSMVCPSFGSRFLEGRGDTRDPGRPAPRSDEPSLPDPARWPVTLQPPGEFHIPNGYKAQ